MTSGPLQTILEENARFGQYFTVTHNSNELFPPQTREPEIKINPVINLRRWQDWNLLVYGFNWREFQKTNIKSIQKFRHKRWVSIHALLDTDWRVAFYPNYVLIVPFYPVYNSYRCSTLCYFRNARHTTTKLRNFLTDGRTDGQLFFYHFNFQHCVFQRENPPDPWGLTDK